jgi:MFS family permease
MPLFFRRNLVHLAAIVLYALVSVLVFSPIFLDNQELYQHDILQGAGGNQEIITYRDKGIEPYWTNSMFSGMPAYLITADYPADWLIYFHSIITLGFKAPANLLFAALISFYFLLLTVRVRPLLALVGGLAYGLSAFILISLEAGHNSKVMAMAYAPLVVAGVLIAFRNKLVLGFALTALGVGLHLRASHLQITYYLLLVLIFFAISHLIYTLLAKQKWTILLKPAGVLILAALVGLACNFGKIYDTYSYSKYSIRGKSELTSLNGQEEKSGGLSKEYAFAWSNGIEESLTLLIPYYYGGASSESVDKDGPVGIALERNQVPYQQSQQLLKQIPTYWGDQPFTAGPIYMGAVAILLFAIGLAFAPGEFKWWLLAVVVVGLVLSWGKNFSAVNNFIFDYLPGYNKFRAVSMALFMVMLAVPLLGFIGLERFLVKLPSWKPADTKVFLYAAGSVIGILLLVLIFSRSYDYSAAVDSRLAQSGYPDWLLDAIRAQRKVLLTADVWRSLILVVLSALSIWYFGIKKPMLPALAACLGLLILFDFYGVNSRYLTEDDYRGNIRREFFAPTAADQAVLQDNSLNYRVLNLENPWNDNRTSYHHKSIGGYHGAKLQRYQDMIDRVFTPEIQQLISGLQQGNAGFNELPGLNMLNAKYLLAGTQKEAVIQNPEALGNAWPVSEVMPVNSPDAEIAAIASLQVADQAVIDESEFNLPANLNGAQGEVTLSSYQPNKLEYEANMQQGGLVVFSEVFYPEGWQATINGQPAEILRANYILRALAVPAGNHKITFSFEPPNRQLVFLIMMIGNILLVGSLLYYLYQEIQKGRSGHLATEPTDKN